MRDKRRYKRFSLSTLDVRGKMVSATEIKIIDISISGISLKLNRRLNIGSEYPFKLEGKSVVSLRGTVVWCALTETRRISDEEMVPIYSAGLQFKKMSHDESTKLLKFIERHKVDEVSVTGGNRLNVRFQITDPKKATLNYSASYNVKTISLGGMLIECFQDLEIESRVPMELYIQNDNSVKFMGKVASSQVIDKEGTESYDIGIEFLDLRKTDREKLSSFIKYSSAAETRNENNPKTTAGEVIAVTSKEFIDLNIESLDLTEKDLEDLTSAIDPRSDGNAEKKSAKRLNRTID